MSTPPIPAEITDEAAFWPRIPLKERLLLSLGYGDPEFGRAFREAKWINGRVLESCEACNLHSPGDKGRLPSTRVFIPGGPTADPAYSFLLELPPGVRTRRVGDGFVEDLRARLGGLDVELTANHTGVWVRVPRSKTPPKPPTCTLEDLGQPSLACRLPLPLGMSQHGPFWADLDGAPHALIAGATGSGKSTLIHACLHFILPRAEVWGIDLKLVELSRYKNRLARLATDPEEVAPLLVALFQETRRRLAEMQRQGRNAWSGQRLVLVVDELAEVTLASKGDTHMLLRLAQLGRAAGVHLLLATQRPSVQIIPGDLKANVPLRVALALPTGVDSRVVLDREGAERLTPPGDALVLHGHSITRISTPDYKAPPPLPDVDATQQPVGLTADERAIYEAVQAGQCRATSRDVMRHFHWGDRRVGRALRGLRATGLLNEVAEAARATGDSADDTPATCVVDVVGDTPPTSNAPHVLFLEKTTTTTTPAAGGAPTAEAWTDPGSGEGEMANGEWRIGDGEWQMANGEGRMAKGEGGMRHYATAVWTLELVAWAGCGAALWGVGRFWPGRGAVLLALVGLGAALIAIGSWGCLKWIKHSCGRS